MRVQYLASIYPIFMNKQAENFLKKLKSSVKSNFENNLDNYGDIDTLIEQFVGALTNDELLAIYRGNT